MSHVIGDRMGHRSVKVVNGSTVQDTKRRLGWLASRKVAGSTRVEVRQKHLL